MSEPDAYREAHDAATASLTRLREVLDDMDVQIAAKTPRPIKVLFQALDDDGHSLAASALALEEGTSHDVEIAFATADGGYQRFNTRISVRA